MGLLLLCVLLSLIFSAGHGHRISPQAARYRERDKNEKTHRPDWAYPIAALRNRKEDLIRIYGQYLQYVVGNNTEKGEISSLASCSFKGNQNFSKDLPLIRPVEELSFIDENNTPNYIIDCKDPGDWATRVVLRLKDGTIIGRWLKIIDMETEKKGSWVACSQPLHTDREWLEGWVSHQFNMGASKVILHAPNGPHIEELFNDTLRQKRIAYNANFLERSAANVGTQPLRRFQKMNVEWFDYWPSPTAAYYAEEVIFALCHYRNRYAYDYSSQFDIDEFWVPTKNVEQTLPEFLMKRLPDNATEAIFHQVYYPLSCVTHMTGDYPSRFTLHRPGPGQSKPVVRPFAVKRMQVHHLMETSPEWQAAHEAHPGQNAVYFNITDAFLKHIRPDNWIDDNKIEHFHECKFGRELDAEGFNAIEE